MTYSRPNLLQSWGQLSRYGSAFLLLLTFGGVTIVGLFLIRDVLRADAEEQDMYAASVQNLHRIGELQYETQETRRSTIYALSTADSNLHVKYADQSKEAARLVSEGIQAYVLNARTPRELEIGRRLEHDWSSYLQTRDKVLASILEGSTKEAVDLDLTAGATGFDGIREDLAELEQLYEEQASQQLAKVEAISGRTIKRVAGVLVITLIATIASVLTIQRIRMAGAMELAKLQMEFVASVSHELRTPLSVVSSAADNIADGVVHGEEDLRRYGRVIRKQSQQINELVSQILQFAATRERKRRYLIRPIEVAEIIQTVTEGTKELMQEKGFTVQQEIELGLPAVMAELSAVSQCIQNLVVNAAKYSGQSRWIGIRAVLSDRVGTGNKEVCICVEDRGIGIDVSEMQRIFDPFYRGSAVSSAQIHGTGLGLSVAKNIAEAMGGRLSVSSQVGLGSVFTLHLPVVGEAMSKIAPRVFDADAMTRP